MKCPRCGHDRYPWELDCGDGVCCHCRPILIRYRVAAGGKACPKTPADAPKAKERGPARKRAEKKAGCDPELERARKRRYYHRCMADPVRKAKWKAYRVARREQNRAAWLRSYHKRMKDPEYRSVRCCRRLLDSLVRTIKGRGLWRHKSRLHTEERLGYSFVEFREHIEALWEPWMTWDNHGEWHVDHVKPIVSFLDEGVTDPSVVNALSNLRPISAEENLAKSARWAA